MDILSVAAYLTILMFAASAILDLFTFRVPNILTLGYMIIPVITLLYLFFAGADILWTNILASLGMFALFFILGLGLITKSYFGGADIKLFMGGVLWFGFTSTTDWYDLHGPSPLSYFLFSTIAGGVWTIIYTLIIRYKPVRALIGKAPPQLAQKGKRYVPYVPAISIVAISLIFIQMSSTFYQV